MAPTRKSMKAGVKADSEAKSGRRWFETTCWPMVLRAREALDPGAEEALERLCRVYWHPLYSFLRRQGHDRHAAQDLTQGFFACLLEKHYLRSAERDKGKFRSFLLSALNHYVADQRKAANRRKRGGGALRISLDMAEAEGRFQAELTHHLSADRLYERRWALTLLETVLNGLRREYNDTGKGAMFDALHSEILGTDKERSYAETAARLRMSEGAVKVAVHRMRRRYQTLLREEIAQTVSSPHQVDEEIDCLIAVLRS